MFTTQNGWTKERMLSHIRTHFAGKSYTVNAETGQHECKYRGPEGKRCAVGLFIPDDRYRESMDSNYENYATSVLERYNLEDAMPISAMGMQQLQQVHDNSASQNTLTDMASWVEAYVTDNALPG